MKKMLCKYCKSDKHTIDNCTELLCKICNKKGHPHWKCPLNKKEKKKEVIQEIDIDDKLIKLPSEIKLYNMNKEYTIEELYALKDISWDKFIF